MRRLCVIAMIGLVAACGGGTDPEPVASVSVSAAGGANSVVVGQTLQLTATVADANGATLTGRKVAWASSNESIATVSSGGLVTGVAQGSVQITASSGGKSGIIGLQVGFQRILRLRRDVRRHSVLIGERHRRHRDRPRRPDEARSAACADHQLGDWH